MEGQGQAYLAAYRLVSKELEFWERASLAAKVSCSPLSLPVLAYSNGHSHAQTPVPAQGEKDIIMGGVTQSLSSNHKRETAQHTTKIGVQGAQDASDYRFYEKQRLHCSARCLTFLRISDITPMRVRTCCRERPSRGTPSAKVSAPSAPGSHKWRINSET